MLQGDGWVAVTLRARLAALIAIVVALALIAQGALGYARYGRLALEDADRDLVAYLQGLSERLTRGEVVAEARDEPGETPSLRAAGSSRRASDRRVLRTSRRAGRAS